MSSSKGRRLSLSSLSSSGGGGGGGGGGISSSGGGGGGVGALMNDEDAFLWEMNAKPENPKLGHECLGFFCVFSLPFWIVSQSSLLFASSTHKTSRIL